MSPMPPPPSGATNQLLASLLGSQGQGDNPLLGMAQAQQSPGAFADNQLLSGAMQAQGGNALDANPLFQQQQAQVGQPAQAGVPLSQAMEAKLLLAKMNLSPQQVSDELRNSENMAHLLAPLARQDGGVTSQQVMSRVGDGVASGMYSALQGAQFLGRMGDMLNTDAPGGGTDRVKASLLKTYVEQHFKGAVLTNMHLQGIAQQLGPALPPPTSVNPGSGAISA